MPASASCPIAVLTAHAGLADAGRVEVEPTADADLFAALSAVPDPRKARGCRHRLVTVLAVSVAAVLAGACSYVAIAEWAQDLPVSARLRLGIGRRAPSEATIRRVLRAVDLDALDAVLSAWLAAWLPDPPPGRPRVIAVDGKTARGARGADGRAAHLLAAFDHDSGVVLGQTTVDDKSNEITAFAPLLDRIDLTDTLITADALHTQRGHAEYLHARGGHYLLIVKRTSPGCTPNCSDCRGGRSRSSTSAATAGTAASRPADSRSPRSGQGSGSRTPASPSRCSGVAARSARRPGAARRSTPLPT